MKWLVKKGEEYLHKSDPGAFSDKQSDAYKYTRHDAAQWDASVSGGRVVKLVPKRKPATCPKGRALTPFQKWDVLCRIYRAWITGDAHHLRLGQLIVCSMGATADDTAKPFFIEDEALATSIEGFVRSCAK